MELGHAGLMVVSRLASRPAQVAERGLQLPGAVVEVREVHVEYGVYGGSLGGQVDGHDVLLAEFQEDPVAFLASATYAS